MHNIFSGPVANRPIRGPNRFSDTWPEPLFESSEARPRLRQHAAQDLLHLVEMLLGAGQRRRKLDDRVAAVVGAADQPRVEQRVRQEAAKQPLGLVVVERLAGGL